MTKRTLAELIQALGEKQVEQPKRVEINYRIIFREDGEVLIDDKDEECFYLYDEDTEAYLIDDVWGLVRGCRPHEWIWRDKTKTYGGLKYAHINSIIAAHPDDFKIVDHTELFTYEHEDFRDTEWHQLWEVCHCLQKF